LELRRPRHIEEQSWEAICQHKQRLDRAWQVPEDLSAAIGSAKELCESVARVVLTERAVTFSRSDDLPKLAKAAHGTLDRLPGRGQAAQIGVRNMSQALLSIVTVMAELRNELGTGHGRAQTPHISREAAVASSDAALMWSGWALTRLDEVHGSRVDLLIAELDHNAFRRGELDQRFDEVGLKDLFADDQYRLGVAVAHRAMNGTFVISESGVEPLQNKPLSWPDYYRRGVADGLLLDSSGSLNVNPVFVPALASIVASMAGADWTEMASKAVGAPVLPGIAIDAERLSARKNALEAEAPSIPDHARPGWDALAARFDEPPMDPPSWPFPTS
jgi:Abortive infection C-terminus